MNKIKFQGFPEGSTVTMSAAQNSEARGPVTVSAWKQHARTPSGDVSFKVYSLFGTDDTDTKLGGEAKRIEEGSVVEVPAPMGMHLHYEDVTIGGVEPDLRRVSFVTDFDERYDAEHLEHPYLPTGVTTLDPTGPQMGLYPGYVCGHTFRGVDLSGNSILTADTVNPNGPVGTVDKTVTCTVSDGTNTGVLTFTVRLIHPLRFYRDRNGATYAPTLGGNRGGVIYVSRDGDFTGAPAAVPATADMHGVFHVTLSDGRIASDTFNLATVRAILFKGGETYTPIEELPIMGEGASLLSSWGTGRAIISGAGRSFYQLLPQNIFRTGHNGLRDGARPWCIHNIDFYGSDFTPSDETWREWWNVLNYTSKNGTIGENTNGDLSAAGYTGDVLSGPAVEGGTAYVQVIRDDDNGDNTGQLITRQVVSGSNGEGGGERTFADGTTLTGPSGTVTFIAAGSRLDRTKRTPPKLFVGTDVVNYTGVLGLTVDKCIIRGFCMSFEGTNRYAVFTDNLIRDWWNYGFGAMFGYNLSLAGNCISLPFSYQGGLSTFSASSVDGNRNTFNSCRSDNPTIPVINNTRHSGYRIDAGSRVSLYKVVGHSYGGHGADHQPFARGPSMDIHREDVVSTYMHGCTFSGGGSFGQDAGGRSANGTLGQAPFTPRAVVWDQCWFRADFCFSAYYLFRWPSTNTGIMNSKFEVPAIGINAGNQEFKLIEFVSKSWDGFQEPIPYVENPDENSVRNFVEDCEFIFLSGSQQKSMRPFDTELRNLSDIVRYVGNTVTIREESFSEGVASFPDIP